MPHPLVPSNKSRWSVISGDALWDIFSWKTVLLFLWMMCLATSLRQESFCQSRGIRKSLFMYCIACFFIDVSLLWHCVQMHPTLQTPWYFLHPCRTEDMLNLLCDQEQRAVSTERQLCAWLRIVFQPFGIKSDASTWNMRYSSKSSRSSSSSSLGATDSSLFLPKRRFFLSAFCPSNSSSASTTVPHSWTSILIDLLSLMGLLERGTTAWIATRFTDHWGAWMRYHLESKLWNFSQPLLQLRDRSQLSS